MVWQDEVGAPFGDTLLEWQENPNFKFYPVNDMRAPIASGTYPARGMVIVPASMNTVASIAHGITGHLVHRAADVCLKEGRRLIVVPRETPLHSVHLENLLTLSRLGAVILPPEPAFYLRPRTIEDIVDFVVGRILVALGIEDTLPPGFRYQARED
jgi:4-hydroxy-3-polyprenylbenzoate decarboxylase